MMHPFKPGDASIKHCQKECMASYYANNASCYKSYIIFPAVSHRPDKDCYKDCGFVLHLSLELCKLTGPSPPPGTRGLSDEQDYISCLADHMQDEDCHDCLCDTLEAEGKNCY